jgi:hypothetical protein
MRMTTAGAGLLLAMGVLTAAPTAGAGQVEATAPRSVGEQLRHQDGKITIHNHNFADMRIYIVREGLRGSRIKIGTVVGNTSANLPVPEGLMKGTDRLQLVAIPIGGSGGVISSSFPSDWCDEVEWTLQQALYLSGQTFSGA